MPNRRMIYLIDDDKICQFATSRLLKMQDPDAEVEVFEDGEIAYGHIVRNLGDKAKMPDIILLDINMPNLDGWQFLDELQKVYHALGKKPEIYMVSSSVSEKDMNLAHSREEITGYVVKPVQEDVIKEILSGGGASLAS